MLFHTWLFILFFLIVYAVYLAVKRTPLRLWWLLLASYVFYGCWNPRYLFLIVYATFVDYAAVMLMARTRRRWLRGLLLAASVANLVALLGQFKYAGFLVGGLNDLLAAVGLPYELPAPGVVWPIGFGFLTDKAGELLLWLGVPYALPPLGLLLPVGISFFTFQSVSYTIDFYRGRIDREPSFIRFATFVSLFPQLVAGPIERARNLLPQLRTERKIALTDVSDGLSLFVVGLFKKIALADYLALYVDKVYGAPGDYQAAALLLATFAFAWQIYFDFSGYTDMARGAARMMGFRLMLNFNNPYLADGLGDFWRRWHVSLSTWFKDYVYIPLGGNRKGEVRTYVNMALTMLISGLWHGAAWTFVIWGTLHAAGRVLTRKLEATAFYRRRVPKIVKQAWVFAFVTFAWIFFRARSLGDAWLIVTRIFHAARVEAAFPLLALGLVLAIWAYQFLYESRLRRVLQLAPVRVALVVGMLLYLATVPGGQSQPFIYFQF
jgi:D-alanyl-lipoteichoic acid acyltransferase DltB (MBOAT superfamily)